MVKSVERAMPKRRKIAVDPELLKEIEDLERRMRATDRRIAETMAMADHVQRRLREIYMPGARSAV